RRVRWRCDCRCTGLYFHDCAWIEQWRPWKCSHANAASVYAGRHQDDPWQDGQGLSEGWPVHLPKSWLPTCKSAGHQRARTQTRGGAVMRFAIPVLAGFALAGSFAFAQPSDGRLRIIHETATLRVAYRTDSRPFSYVDDQGRPVGYTIELCERVARSLEAQLNVALTIKWVPVDERTRFDAIVNDTADM